MFNPI